MDGNKDIFLLKEKVEWLAGILRDIARENARLGMDTPRINGNVYSDIYLAQTDCKHIEMHINLEHDPQKSYAYKHVIKFGIGVTDADKIISIDSTVKRAPEGQPLEHPLSSTLYMYKSDRDARVLEDSKAKISAYFAGMAEYMLNYQTKTTREFE